MTTRANVYWNRLVPYTRSSGFIDNMQARVADPLWMLGRQWQLGEFQGEDAGSLVDTELVATLSPLTKFRPRGDRGTPVAVPYHPPTQPLETMVERERARQRLGGVSSPTELRGAAEAGAHFLRLLSDRGFAEPDYETYRQAFIAAYPMGQPDQASDPASKRFAKLMAGKMVDGFQLEAALRAALAVPTPAIPPEVDADFGADEAALLEVAAEWLSWWDALMSEAGPEESTWVEARLEHRFDVGVQLYDAAAAPEQEIVLAADEYPGGRLDWSAFDYRVKADAAPADPLPGTASDDSWAERTIEYRGLPAPIEIGGMPTPRFWEMEEGRVDMSRIEPAADDFGRMLLMEFVMAYSNDWQLIPLDVPVGTVLRVASLKATDTFGTVLEIPASPPVGDSNDEWGMYQISPRTEAGDTPTPVEATGAPLFLMPPVLGAFQQGTSIEEVRFLRDEMANLAWGVERVVPSPLGTGHDRLEEHKERIRREQGTSWADLSVEGLARYELASRVPRHWIPLLPVPTEVGGRKNRFLAGRMRDPVSLDPVHPTGTLLQNDFRLPAVEPIYARNDGVLQTNSTSYVDSACETSALASGIDYLVIYGASCSNDSASGFCDIRLMHGAAAVGEAGMESSTIGFASLPSVGQKQQGFLRVTGNGADTLRLQYRDRGGNDSQVDGQYIIAIPLESLVEGEDYFHVGTTDAADEIAAQGDGSWATLRDTDDLDVIPNGRYLVLMSCEARFSGSGSSAAGCMVRARVNGEALFPSGETDDAWQVEWEDDTDVFCWAVCGVESVSGGDNSFAIEVKSRNATTTAWRRSNIWLVKTSTFDQVVQTRASAPASTTQSYPSPAAVFTALDTTYAAAQAETVVVLSMTQPGQTDTGNATAQELVLGDGSARATHSGQGFRDVSSAGDNWPVTMAAVESLATEAEQTYRVRFGQLSGGTAYLNAKRDKTAGPVANLIVWSMSRSRSAEASPDMPGVIETPFWVWEEEVPRAGAHVTRRYEYARWNDGSSHLWVGRRTRPGLGEGSSRLVFDNVTDGEETIRPAPPAPDKVGLIPVTAFQDTQQSTLSGTPTSANCQTAPLAAGVDYLVIYRGTCGNSSGADSGVLQLRLGAGLDVGYAASEGSGTNAHYSGDQCQGFARVTGNGTDALQFLFNESGGSTAYAGSMAIIAIPLTQLSEGSDYWYSGADTSVNELSGAPTALTVVRELSVDLPEAGEYLVLMSCEGSPGSSFAHACRVSCEVDGLRWGDGGQNQDWIKEHESDSDWFGFAFAGLETLPAGAHTFTLKGASRSATTADFRRSRIWVVRAAAFDQIQQVRDVAGTTTTSSAFTDFLSNAYVPKQAENVVVLGATSVGQSNTDASALCQLVTNVGARNVDAGPNMNDGGFDANSDRPTILLCAAESLSAGFTYRLQVSDGHAGGTARFGRNRQNSAGAETNLIVWSLTYLRSTE